MRDTCDNRTHWLALCLALILALGACSAADDEATESFDAATEEATFDDADVAVDGGADAMEAMESEAPTDEAADEGAASPGSGGLADTAALPVVDTGRDIIFTATVGVEVEDVAAAGQQASTAISGLGGVLFGQVTTSEGVPRSTLTFKVPPAQFQTALARLGDIGFLRDQVITADDVTERVVDLESQIITAQLSVDRLRGFLEQATTLTEIADLEQQLLVRETTLEQLRGQLRTIEGQVSLATITVTFTQRQPGPELEIEQSAYLGHDGAASCPGLDELSGTEGDLISVCYRITNVGDTFLDQIDVRDDGLGLDLDDLAVVDGSLGQPLAIGASVVLVAEIEAEPFRDGRAQASGLPVSEGGVDLLLGRVTTGADLDLDIEEDTSLPGFLDGLSAGLGALLALVQLLVLVAGAVLPFIWLLPLGWFLRRRWQARKQAALPPPPVAPPTRPEYASAAAPTETPDSVERGEGPEVEG